MLPGKGLAKTKQLDNNYRIHAKSGAMMDERRQAKEAKLLQYGERVWGIREGSVAARIDAAIAKTREFFEAMGTKTRLADYGVGQEGVDQVIAQLQAHGMTALGETREVTPEVSRRVLERSL